MEELLKDVPEYIKTLKPYPPGKPLEELEREYGIKNSIKLASNENDLGPSTKVIKKLKDVLKKLHRYPDGSGYYLKKALSEKFKCQMENIVLGNGSNELIDFLCRVFIRPGKNAISSKPSFLVYSKMVQITGGDNKIVPLKDNTHDLKAIRDAVDESTRIIFLDNPNNPMGTVIKEADFDSFLKDLPDHLLVVLDEAYGEFVSDETDWAEAIKFLKKDERIVMLRTFSKAYGLAGLRIGYGIMSPKISSLLERVRQPFNVNIMAQEAALNALFDEKHLKVTLENNREEMIRIKKELEAIGCTSFDSNTNFMLIETFRDANAVYEEMLRQGVIIRSMNSYGFPTFIRLTIGTKDENDRFLQALKKVLDKIPMGEGRR